MLPLRVSLGEGLEELGACVGTPDAVDLGDDVVVHPPKGLQIICPSVRRANSALTSEVREVKADLWVEGRFHRLLGLAGKLEGKGEE